MQQLHLYTICKHLHLELTENKINAYRGEKKIFTTTE